MIVTDESLTQAIAELRRAFRTADPRADIIETVPRTGYRLLVEPAEIQDAGRPADLPAGIQSLEAYALVLEAEMALIRGESGAIADAVESSGEALRIAPDSAATNSAHAYALTVRARYGSGGPEDLSRALQSANWAVSLDPSSPEGHAALGYALSAAELASDPARPLFLAARAARQFDRNTSERTARRCVAALRQKLAGDPEDVRSLYSLGPALALAGHRDAAWDSMVTLPEVDTLCAIHLAFGFGALGETRMALDALERAVDEGYRDRAWLFQEHTLRGARRERRFQHLTDHLAAA